MNNNLFALSGQVAIVTGGGRGLGRAMALGLAEAGATVVVGGRTPETLAETVAEIARQGGRADFQQMDVQDEEAGAALLKKTLDTFGRLDILINNAGVAPTQPAADISTREWDRVLDINLGSQFRLCRQAAEVMRSAGSGSIINIASVLGAMAGRGVAHYCASKGGLIQMTRALALEWAPDNIRVNCLAPGFFQTDMTRAQQEDPATRKFLLRKIPFGRLGRPQEVVGAAVFLASPAAAYVTGSTVYVDGGYSIW